MWTVDPSRMGEPPHVHERERNALLAPAADQLTCPQRSPAQPGWHSQPPETQYPLKPAQSAAVEQAAGGFAAAMVRHI